MIPFLFFAVLLILFLSLILIRAFLFRPAPVAKPNALPVTCNREKIISDMQAMIRCKTVSYSDETLTDFTEFEKFRTLLEDKFPLLHQRATKMQIGKTGLLYHISGSTPLAPIVCMAHYDVVPARESDWNKPAFSGIIEEDTLWGRGTLDTKSTVCAILEAAEQLLSENFCPKRDLYLAFSGDEEINGPSCPAMVDWFEKQGITPAMVLDEGGAVVENIFPGVTGECALVGVAEKGTMNLKLTITDNGGHASTPPAHTPIGQLAHAMVTIERKPFKAKLTKPVAAMFDTLGRHTSFGYKILFANLWCFYPVILSFCKRKGGELNALMRTTCALTRMEGSDSYNVLPPVASVGMNLRLSQKDTMDSALAYLKRIIKNDAITYKIESGTDPSICSDTDSEAYSLLQNVIHATWPKAIVSPYLMMACSDSRHYCRITDKVYRFSPMKLSKEERAMIHGHNERIPLDTLVTAVEFYIRLFGQL